MATAPTNFSRLGWGFPTTDLIVQARQKLPRSQVDAVAKLGGLTKKEMALVVGITEWNLYNQHQGDLSVPLSERLLLLEKLFQHGLAVFDGNQQLMFDWMRTPLAELATPEVGFAAPETDYVPKPMDQMGTKEELAELIAAVQARRQRLAGRTGATEPQRSYPTPLSLLDTTTGCKLVDNVFTGIEAEVFS